MGLHAGAQHGVFSHQPLRLNITAHLAIGGVGTQGRCRASLHLLLHSLTLARDGLKG